MATLLPLVQHYRLKQHTRLSRENYYTLAAKAQNYRYKNRHVPERAYHKKNPYILYDIISLAERVSLTRPPRARRAEFKVPNGVFSPRTKAQRAQPQQEADILALAEKRRERVYVYTRGADELWGIEGAQAGSRGQLRRAIGAQRGEDLSKKAAARKKLFPGIGGALCSAIRSLLPTRYVTTMRLCRSCGRFFVLFVGFFAARDFEGRLNLI